MKESAETAPNRAGKVFTIGEFQKLLTTIWVIAMIDQGVSLADWLILAFCAKSFLLGALRGEQFDRFRKGGLDSVTYYRDNRDTAGCLHPIREPEYSNRCSRIAVSSYNRVKNANGADSTRVDEDFELAITCLCEGHHEPIEFVPDRQGNPVGPVVGNLQCWFGLFEWVTKDVVDRKSKLVTNQWVA